jgi:hypothetical protein
LGSTATVWTRRASSSPAGVAFSVVEPPCTGEDTVVPLSTDQVRIPVVEN